MQIAAKHSEHKKREIHAHGEQPAADGDRKSILKGGQLHILHTEHFEAQLVLVMGKSPIKMQNAPAGWQNRAIDIYYIMSKMGP